MEKNYKSFGLVFFFVIILISSISSVFLMVRQNPLMSISFPLLVSGIPYFLGIGILDEFESFSREIQVKGIRYPFLFTMGSNPKTLPLDSYRFQFCGIILFLFGLFLGILVFLINLFSTESFSWSIHSPSILFLLILSYSVSVLLVSILFRFVCYFAEKKKSKNKSSKR